MPQNIVQFQVVPIQGGGHTIYALDADGRLWLKPGGNVGHAQGWMPVES